MPGQAQYAVFQQLPHLLRHQPLRLQLVEEDLRVFARVEEGGTVVEVVWYVFLQILQTHHSHAVQLLPPICVEECVNHLLVRHLLPLQTRGLFVREVQTIAEMQLGEI